MINVKTWVFYLFCITCLTSSFTEAQTPATIERFVEAYNTEQFDVAIANFHISDELSQSERGEEIEGLTVSFRILFEEFGRIKSLREQPRQLLPPEELADIDIYSMSEDYWKNRQALQTKQFTCRFDDISNGQLEFVLYSSNGQMKLRSVNFALPLSLNNSQAIVNRVGKKLHAFYQDRSLRKKALSGQVRLSVLFTSTRKAAVAAKKMLQTGASFSEAVKKYSIEQSASPQGDMGYVFPEDVLPTLQSAAINLNVDEVSDILPLNGKYVLVKKTDQK